MTFLILTWMAPKAVQVFFNRPDTALVCFILVFCAPIAFAELDRRIRLRRRERIEATGFVESYETVRERLDNLPTLQTWYSPTPVNRPGAN
jgi:hypothetical protein